MLLRSLSQSQQFHFNSKGHNFQAHSQRNSGDSHKDTSSQICQIYKRKEQHCSCILSAALSAYKLDIQHWPRRPFNDPHDVREWLLHSGAGTQMLMVRRLDRYKKGLERKPIRWPTMLFRRV